jgi:hypothetical protein
MKEPLIRDAREVSVSEAYRALPQPEPSQQLDARIWARVADFLDTAETEKDIATIPNPAVPSRSRRFAAPMALAAIVLSVCAVGYLWLRGNGSALPAAENRSLITAQPLAPKDVSEAPHANAAADTAPPLPEASIDNAAAKISREPQRARAVQLDAVAFEKSAVREKQGDAALRAKVIIPVQPAASAPGPNRPEKLAETEAAASAQLVLVRDLLREGRRNAAQQAFKSWRTTYPQAAVPDDLRGLVVEPEPPPALPEEAGEGREP